MGKFLFLSFQELETIGVKTAELVDVLEEVFHEIARGGVIIAKKVSLRMPDRAGAFINSMPAYLKYRGVAGIKWVAGFPEAVKHGQPYITGTIILNDCSTGQPLCIMDGTLITRVRTAAVSILGAKYLRCKGASVVGLIGCGQLGRAHLEAAIDYLPTKTAYCFDMMPNLAQSMVDDLQGKNGVEIVACTSWQEVLEKSDVVFTCTVPQKPFLAYKHVKPGSAIVSIEGRQVWFAEDYLKFDKLCVDEWESLKEGTHVKELVNTGLLTEENIYADLGELVTHKKQGRESEQETILLLTRGLGAADVAIANLYYERALQMGIGEQLTMF
jgi:ornithine cyclodeaminase/alanine dehydrogenase-like protein (mu-crystallin family)